MNVNFSQTKSHSIRNTENTDVGADKPKEVAQQKAALPQNIKINEFCCKTRGTWVNSVFL